MPVPIGDDRMHDAIRFAQLAFFAALAKSFPEITTGDFDPTDDDRFTAASADAAVAWVKTNGRDVLPTYDQLSVLARVAREAAEGRYGDHNRGRCYEIHARQSNPHDDPLLRPDARSMTISVLWQDAMQQDRETRIIVRPEGGVTEQDVGHQD